MSSFSFQTYLILLLVKLIHRKDTKIFVLITVLQFHYDEVQEISCSHIN